MTQTNTPSDAALLQQYRAGDHDAFRTLVHRHTDWVFAAARRQAPDTATAEDITQAVFLLLARRAASLPDDTRITGFLFKAACFAARTARRAAARRRRHEHKAAAMKPAHELPSTPDLDLDSLKPRLDALLLSLPARDRTALLFRFYQQRPLADLAAALNTSEKGAAKQVARALDRLRKKLPRHAALSAAAITAFLSTRLAHAAPPTLAHAAATTALTAAAGGAVPSAITLLAKGAAHMFTATLRLSLLAIAIAAAAIPPILAASKPPATAPATTAASETPLTPLLTFAAASDTLDPAALARAFSATTPDEKALLATLQSLLTAQSDLNKAYRAKFLPDPAAPLPAAIQFVDHDSFASIQKDAHATQIDDTHASISTGPNDQHPTTVQLIDGHWRIPLSDYTQGPPGTPDKMKLTNVMYSFLVAALTDTAKEITNGTLTTPEAAQAALTKRRDQAQQDTMNLLTPPSP